MTLYEIDTAILDCVDEETGEIIDFEKLDALCIERENKIKNVARWYKDTIAEVEAFKAEKEKLSKREDKAKIRAQKLKEWLARVLDGEKFKSGTVDIRFRSSETLDIDDNDEFVKWAMDNGRDDLLSYQRPTPSKTMIKTALKDGAEIPYVALRKKININIK